MNGSGCQDPGVRSQYTCSLLAIECNSKLGREPHVQVSLKSLSVPLTLCLLAYRAMAITAALKLFAAGAVAKV